MLENPEILETKTAAATDAHAARQAASVLHKASMADWQKREAARKIAKSAKSIWSLSNKAELHKMARLAELLFYEAYGKSGGKVSQTPD